MKARPLLVQLHRYLGLLAGGVAIVVGLSGSALVFRPEIDGRINGRISGRLEAIDPLDRRVPLERVVANIRDVVPGARVAEILFPGRLDRALSVVVSAPDAPWLRVYADPYTGEVLNTRPPGVFEFLRELHSTLFVDRIAGFAAGWYLVGAFGLLLFSLCVSGLSLSWPGRRGLRGVLRINRGLSWKRTNWDLHRVAGILASLLILAVTVSGTMVVFRELFRPPDDPTILTPGLFGHGGPSLSRRWAAPALPLDRLLRRAEAAAPGGRPVAITVPELPEAPLSIGIAPAGEAAGSGGTIVWIDRQSRAIVKVEDPRSASLASTIFGEAMNAIHTGRIAGLPGRVVVLAAGLAPTLLFVTGLPIWWSKRRARRQQAARRATVPQDSRAARL